ncbi:hypothetical protein IFR05_006568 [Cadophora sp. M221]|nr:hypothetical protein IFR05_006568 [Cadophora sp. M221]
MAAPRRTYEDFCRQNLVGRGTAAEGQYPQKSLNAGRREIRLLKILNRRTFEDLLFTPEGLQKSEEDAEFRLDNERTFVIKAAIEVYPLASAPPYVALSYVWGDLREPRRPVFVPDNPDDNQAESYYLIEVTENLFQALRQLSPLRNISHIWADAICINQEDNAEKNWQVKQMWDIYQSSKFVVMWMGSGSPTTNALMDSMMESMQQETERVANGGGSFDQLRVPDAFMMLDGFKRLTEMPYWTRAWIRQEISSQNPDQIIIVYGRRMILFQVLPYLVRAITNTAQELEAIAVPQRTPRQATICRIARTKSFRLMSDALESSLSEKARIIHIMYNWVRKIYLWGDGLQATDPRDLIYSLVWMTTWRPDQPDSMKRMEPDYNIPAREVYINMAKEWPRICIWRNGFESESLNDLDLPSWVPDWRHPIHPVHLLKLPPWQGNSEGQYWAGNMLAYAGGYEIKPTRYSESATGESSVHMEGFVLDTIDDMSSIMVRDSESSNREVCRQFIAVLSVLARTIPKILVDELAQELASVTLEASPVNLVSICRRTIWQLPIMNIGIDDGWLKKAPESYERAFDFLSHRTLPAVPTPRGDSDLKTTISRYADIAVEACHNRRFFRTKKGFLGLAFPSVQLGDLVVVFPGLDVPLVLRRHTGGDGYQIVSDAYVQGIMDGETKKYVRPGGFELEEFRIF